MFLSSVKFLLKNIKYDPYLTNWHLNSNVSSYKLVLDLAVTFANICRAF